MDPANPAQRPSEIDFATLDLLPDGVIVVDASGKVLYYNAREEQIAGRKRENVIGKNFFTEVAPCTLVQTFYGRFQELVKQEGQRETFEFSFPFPDRPREVEITLTTFRNLNDRLCLISVRDITEIREVRDRIMRAERLREIGEVAAGVAHNFNNLLMVIRGNVDLLLRQLPEDHASRPRIERILKASDNGAEMVRRLSGSAQQRPDSDPNRSTVSVNAMIRDSLNFAEQYLREIAARRGVHIAVDVQLDDDLPSISANASELREVFLNLLRNAAEAISADGTIKVSSLREGSQVVVEISDSGEGMSPEVLGKIFRPLFTTKGERGTGMGLATCYAIVRRHGGDITVKSAPGVGTTFAVRLPRAT